MTHFLYISATSNIYHGSVVAATFILWLLVMFLSVVPFVHRGSCSLALFPIHILNLYGIVDVVKFKLTYFHNAEHYNNNVIMIILMMIITQQQL